MPNTEPTPLRPARAPAMPPPNAVKANFDSIYEQADPRAYFRELYGLDYIIPELARPVFAPIVNKLERLRGRPLRILDIGCSYGINAALLQYPVDLDRLAKRYADMPEGEIGPAQLAMLDRNYFRSWPRRPMEIIGLDASPNAVGFARTSGVLHGGIVGDFERDPLPPDAVELLRGIDLIISTGAVGYVTEKTFAKVLAAIGEPRPWVASFVLRMFPFDAISKTLADAGLQTEPLAGTTFVQRRFKSEAECREVTSRLTALGIDPEGKESEGLLHANFYLSRPEHEAQDLPLADLVSIAQGTRRAFGRRFVIRPGEPIRLVR